MAAAVDTTGTSPLLGQLESIQNNAPSNKAARRALAEATRRLASALEDPADTLQRIVYLPLQLSALKVASDMKVLEVLAEADGPMKIGELAETTDVELALLERILRYLAAFDMIEELDEGVFGPNQATKTMASAAGRAGMEHHAINCNSAIDQLAPALAADHYRNPTNNRRVAFQRAFHTEKTAFEYWVEHPAAIASVSAWMGHQRHDMPSWLDTFAFERDLGRGSGPDTVLFVDIGGSLGHQCADLRKRLSPDTRGRIVLQDLPAVLAAAPDTPGVEKMAHDFWTEQPVKGARTYYLRNVLHDWPDVQAVQILRHTREAMAPDSVVLVDEAVVPARGAPWRAAQLDLLMMTLVAGTERTRAQWEALVAQAGLKIERVVEYTDEVNDAILVLVPA